MEKIKRYYNNEIEKLNSEITSLKREVVQNQTVKKTVLIYKILIILL